MNSLVLKIANLYIKFNYNYDLIYELSKKYIVNSYDHIDIELNNININKFLENNNYGEAEVLAILEALADNIYKFNILLIHGAAIEYNNKAYLFMGPSGIGKSTHIKYWKKVLKDVNIINGDKPFIDEKGYLYGTPWSGKERWSRPVSYKLDSLIFIYRDTYNHIEKVNNEDILKELLDCIYLPEKSVKSLNLVNTIFSNIPIYKIYCINDISAAELCISEVVK